MRDIEIKSKDFFVDDVLVATGYTRVVHGYGILCDCLKISHAIRASLSFK